MEPDELTPFVLNAQDVYIQELLGTKFYNNLKSRVLSGTTSTPEKTLLNDYIAPCLANYSVYLALPSFNYKMKNKSVLNPSAEEARNTDITELKYLRENVKNMADFYRERSREYLIDNDNDFPDYINYGVDGMAPNKRNTYSSGIVFPSNYGTCLPGDIGYVPNCDIIL
jgi:hypothetical protein